MRVALYARYSSDRQNERSCEDQRALLAAHAQRRGWTVAATFQDAALSGTAMANRPGLNTLIAAAEGGLFDLVLVEHQDRLARNLEHEAHIFNRLKRAGVRIATLATDEVRILDVAIGGLMGELYIEALSEKTKRGMHANAEQGLATGARMYGYRSAPGGALAIHPPEADVVREVLARLAAGETIRAVCLDLNARRVPGPRGGLWHPSTWSGSKARGSGLLACELYVGTKVWNRIQMTKDRTTGRRACTPRPEAEWRRTPVPHLRLVDDATWAAVQAHRRTRAALPPSQRAPRPHGKGLFAGLIRCAECQGAMTAFNSRGRLICARRRAHGPTACSNNRSVPRAEVEARVLEALRTRLLAPAAVRAYVQAYHQAWNEQQALAQQQLAPMAKRLAELDRAIPRLVDRICDGLDTPETNARLKALEAERMLLQAQLATAQRQAPPPVTLHPGLPDQYARRVQDLQAHLARKEDPTTADDAAVAAVRDLVQRIDVRAIGDDGELLVRLHGTLAAFLDPPENSRAPGRLYKVVAGARYDLKQTMPALQIAC